MRSSDLSSIRLKISKRNLSKASQVAEPEEYSLQSGKLILTAVFSSILRIQNVKKFIYHEEFLPSFS